jgi:serine/threonine-protein kinase
MTDLGPETGAATTLTPAADGSSRARHDDCAGPVERPDEYELVERGHRGGEGIIWRARYRGTLPVPIEFAVKQLIAPPGLASGEWPTEGQFDRWNEQLKLLYLVHHDHLVAYRELFLGWPPHPRGTCAGEPPPELRTWYLVMTWADGPTLHQVVREGGASLSERAAWVAQVADAVGHLHSGADTAGMSLLHRDVKPSNIVIDPSRGAILVDYGLLRVEEPTLTEVPAWTGPYLAPEAHADKTRTSRASDMWSVAATAYFSLTGEHPTPFEPQRMRERLAASIQGQVASVDDVTDLVAGVLERRPEERPRNPAAWGRNLERAAGTGTMTPSTSSPSSNAPQSAAPPLTVAPPMSVPQPAAALPIAAGGVADADPITAESERRSYSAWRWVFAGVISAALLATALVLWSDRSPGGTQAKGGPAKTSTGVRSTATTLTGQTSSAGGVGTDAGTTTSSGPGGSGGASPGTPSIQSVAISGSVGDYSLIVSGTGFGTLPETLPFSGDTQFFRIGDNAALGHGEWGYSGDANALTYQIWSHSRIEVTGFSGAPGDALVLAMWNPATGIGATWGGNVPATYSGTPAISSVSFSGSGQNLRMTVTGSGLGSPPGAAVPAAAVFNHLEFLDARTHCNGSLLFGAGGNSPAAGPSDQSGQATLVVSSWSNTKIRTSGFAGAYGSGCDQVQPGDPVAVSVWSLSDPVDTGAQTAWGGVLP